MYEINHFEIHTVISNKVVRVLLHARKYGFVAFEGKTLFQRKEDNVIIALQCPASKVKEISREAKSDPDLQWGKCLKQIKSHCQNIPYIGKKIGGE